MTFLTCASFFGTGSSAVTDFLSEFDNVRSMGKYEYRLVWDPDGISDLEFNLIQNNIRTNMTYAIDRFIRFTESLTTIGYGKGYRVFGEDLKKLTDQYLNEITELETHSYWMRNKIDKGKLFCFIDRSYSSAVKRLFKKERGSNHSLLEGKKTSYFSAISEEEFLEATRRYMDRLFGTVNQGAEYLMVDQMVPPTNTERYIRYFNDIKVIVVDRDPRDVFLFDKTRWKSHKIPTENAEDYVKWWKITHKHVHPEKEDPNKILRIQFEDMIFKYDETMNQIRNFVGMDEKDHIQKRMFFNPDVSIKNTELKNRTQGYEKEIRYIEENLQECLYPFSEYTGSRR